MLGPEVRESERALGREGSPNRCDTRWQSRPVTKRFITASANLSIVPIVTRLTAGAVLCRRGAYVVLGGLCVI